MRFYSSYALQTQGQCNPPEDRSRGSITSTHSVTSSSTTGTSAETTAPTLTSTSWLCRRRETGHHTTPHLAHTCSLHMFTYLVAALLVTRPESHRFMVVLGLGGWVHTLPRAQVVDLSHTQTTLTNQANLPPPAPPPPPLLLPLHGNTILSMLLHSLQGTVTAKIGRAGKTKGGLEWTVKVQVQGGSELLWSAKFRLVTLLLLWSVRVSG